MAGGPNQIANGELLPDRTDALFEAAYQELKRLAKVMLATDRSHDEVQTTELVHEAVRKLMANEVSAWQTRAHFFGAAANAMRQVLIDAARKRQRKEHALRITAGQETHPGSPDGSTSEDLLELDTALREFEKIDPRAAQVVLLKYFGGMSISQIAEVVDLSERSVKRDWAVARAWLFNRLNGHTNGSMDA